MLNSKILTMSKTQYFIGILVLIAFFGICFWPTLFKYEKLKVFETEQLIRINRINGSAKYFNDGKWEGERELTTIDTMKVLPLAKRAEVSGQTWFYYNTLHGELYNGSDWTITQVVIRLRLKELDGGIRWDRKFQTNTKIKPLSVGTFSFPVIDIDNRSDYFWEIADLKGFTENQP